MTSDIGERVRQARTQQGKSLRAVASELGVSASLLSQIETGKTQPSVSTLYALVNHLGLSIDEILGVGAPRAEPTAPIATRSAMPLASAGAAVIQHARDNPVLEMENGVRWERLAVGSDGGTDSLLVTYEPGASSSVEGKLMRHAGFEHAYILEGSLTLHLDFDTYVLEAGDSLFFDSVRPHMYLNSGDVPARGVWFVVGRRAQQSAMPDATVPIRPSRGLNSAVDVLRALDGI
jgi:transcriptional regulator with XRE-family HTH domain